MRRILNKSTIVSIILVLVLALSACSTAVEPVVTSQPSPVISESIATPIPTLEAVSTPKLTATPTQTPEPTATPTATPAPIETPEPTPEGVAFSLDDIPEYSGKPFVVINGNIPFFSDSEMTNVSFERYAPLDNLGRCGVAVASVGIDIMPTEERGDIGNVEPTGWVQEEYDNVDGGYLYNRCHILGFQLTGENANEQNLITGTRYMNVDGMLPFENMIADYVKETGNHVYYRVTPIFEGDNLLASGVLMEAKSVEDNGEGILFNVYCFNVQDGIDINYATGKSSSPDGAMPEDEPTPEPEESAGEPESIADIDTNGNGTVTIAEAKAAGFSMPITSDHWLYKYMKDADGDGKVGE